MLFDVCLKNIDIYFDRFNFKPELQTNWSGYSLRRNIDELIAFREEASPGKAN